MFLKNKSNDDLVEVLTMNDLFDPFCKQLIGRYHHGEEDAGPGKIQQVGIVFPVRRTPATLLAGRPLPRR